MNFFSTCLLGLWVGGWICVFELGADVFATCWKWHLKSVRRFEDF